MKHSYKFDLIRDQSVAEDTSWSLQLPVYPGLTFKVALSNGEPLPSWLTYDDEARTISGTPPANFHGSHEIKVIARYRGEILVTEPFKLTVVPSNDAPVAPAVQVLEIDEDGASDSIAVDAQDVDGDGLVYAVKAGSEPAKGTVSFDQANGTFVYTPHPDAHGPDSFTVVISDGKGGTAEQVVNVTIRPANDEAKIAGSRAGAVTEDGAQSTGGVLSLTDVDAGENVFGTVDAADLETEYGTFAFDAATGVWGFIFDNEAAQSLRAGDRVQQTLTVTSLDGTAQETITVAVVGANDGPTVSTAVEAAQDEGSGTLAVNLLEGAFDVDDGETATLKVAGLTQTDLPEGLVLSADGKTVLVDTAHAAFKSLSAGESKVITFAYMVEDAQGAQVAQTAFITITGKNDAPVAAGADNGASGAEDTTISGRVPAGSDVDGDVLGYELVEPIDGLSFNADGTFSYVPAANFNGTATFQYRVVDVAGAKSAAQAFTLTVTSVNDMPASLSLTGSTVLENAAQGTVVGTLSAWDPDGDSPFNFSLLDDAGGRFALQGNQLVVANGFLLDYEQATSHQVKLRVADGHGGSFEQNVTLSLVDVLNEKNFGSSSANRMIGGKGKDWLSGGAGNDFISAGAGNDRVEGGSGDDNLNGGYGKDTLVGGSGKDRFVFSDKPSKTGNLDSIADFSVKDDSIWLDNAVFAKLGKSGSAIKPAALNKAFFTIGDKAKDKNDYLIYDKQTGYLSYDADGSGKGKAVEIAKLSKNLSIKHSDFFVV